MQLVVSREALKNCSRFDIDGKLAVLEAGECGAPRKSLRMWTDDDDDSDEVRQPCDLR